MRELRPCPCAREWLAAMVEEGMRRRPADAGAAWLLNWLLAESNLNTREQDAIVKELEEADSRRHDIHDWTD